MAIFNYNGQLYKDNKPIFSINNRGVKYGDAIFETIKVCNGKPLFFNSHKQRLLDAMDLLKMNIPEWFKQFYLFMEIEKTLEANKIRKGGRIRLSVIRKDGGLYTPESNDIDIIIEATAEKNNEYILNDIGLRVGLFDAHNKYISPFGRFKTANSLIYILAAIYKQENQLDDCLILNSDNNLCEAISSNVFLVRGGIVYTPSDEEGAVRGIMQRHISEIIKKMGLSLEETEIKPAMVEDCKELFLTNTIKGIQWVNTFGKKVFKNDLSKKLIVELNNYTNKVN